MLQLKQITTQILLLFVLLQGGASLFGQDLDPTDLMQTNNLQTANWVAGKENSVYSTQVGLQNTTLVEQTNTGSSATPNLVRNYTEGDMNLNFVWQAGQNNVVDILQTGDMNFAVSKVEGNNNTTLFVQNGNNNTLTQNLVNSNNVVTELIQNGNNNMVEQNLTNSNGGTYQFTQNGNNLKLIIRQTY